MPRQPLTSLRITGGRWNGRKIRLPAHSRLRPSSARLRESLFSYLGSSLGGGHDDGGGLVGMVCLDLFAGSGALGLCAASAGARHVTFVEKDRQGARALAQFAAELGAAAAVHTARAEQFLAKPPQSPLPSAAPSSSVLSSALSSPDAPAAAALRYDVVFLDPPFGDYPHDEDWAVLLEKLAPHLRAESRVYCEYQRHFTPPQNWRVLTARRTAAVYWQVLQPAAGGHLGGHSGSHSGDAIQ